MCPQANLIWAVPPPRLLLPENFQLCQIVNTNNVLLMFLVLWQNTWQKQFKEGKGLWIVSISWTFWDLWVLFATWALEASFTSFSSLSASCYPSVVSEHHQRPLSHPLWISSIRWLSLCSKGLYWMWSALVCFLLWVSKSPPDADEWFPRRRTFRRDRVISTEDAHSLEGRCLTQERSSLSHSFTEERTLPLFLQGAL